MRNEIAVIMTTYNHEKYIREAIDSILNQTFKDFELIIVDDGSSDNTKNIIMTIDDDRIKRVFKENEGPSLAVNTGIEISSSKYIALMSGDDVSSQDRLLQEYHFLKANNYKAVFSLPNIIDTNGISISEDDYPTFFLQNPTNKEAVLKRFLSGGNFYCAPSALLERDIVVENGMFSASNIQVQDFELWIKIAKKHHLPIIQDKLVSYRRHNNNLSDDKSGVRIGLELELIFEHFFDDLSWEKLHEMYPQKISLYSKINSKAFDIEKAFIFLTSNIPEIREVGKKLLYKYFNRAEYRKELYEIYRFYFKDLFLITGSK